jgi:hypothetical protein
MYLIPKSEITIGSARFYGENSGIKEVEISMSVVSLANTAVITIPRNFVKKDGRGVLDVIHVGDRVNIRLGYGDNINDEFKGYVSKIGDGTPIRIEVDDEWYPFKKSEPLNKSWATTQLTEVLRFCFPGYGIEFAGNKTAEIKLSGGFIIDNTTPYQAIKGLKESYGFATKIDEQEKKITCFYPYDFSGYNTHTYVFGTRDEQALQGLQNRKLSPNVAKNDLKFERKEDVKLQVTAKAKQRDGKELSVTVGSKEDGATKRTLTFGSEINNATDLKARAEEELARRSFDGYTGKITGFGAPQVMPGDNLTIIDTDNPEREATYLVEAVAIKYVIGTGFRRECTLSYKVK